MIKYIPWNMHMVLFCYAMFIVFFYHWFLWIQATHISGLLHCACTSDATLLDMSKRIQYLTTTKHNKHKHCADILSYIVHHSPQRQATVGLSVWWDPIYSSTRQQKSFIKPNLTIIVHPIGQIIGDLPSRKCTRTEVEMGIMRNIYIVGMMWTQSPKTYALAWQRCEK